MHTRIGVSRQKGPSTRDLFSSKLLTTLQCTSCTFTRSKLETYKNLSLTPSTSLSKSLENYFNPQTVSIKCEKCEGETARKTLAIKETPKCLMLHLKR